MVIVNDVNDTIYDKMTESSWEFMRLLAQMLFFLSWMTKKIKMSLMSYTNVTKSGDFNDIINDINNQNDRNLIGVPDWELKCSSFSWTTLFN